MLLMQGGAADCGAYPIVVPIIHRGQGENLGLSSDGCRSYSRFQISLFHSRRTINIAALDYRLGPPCKRHLKLTSYYFMDHYLHAVDEEESC